MKRTESNPALRTRMLKSLERREAWKSFDKFDEVWRPVVNYDPCNLGALKYRISLLAGRNELSHDDEAAILRLPPY